MQAQLQRGRSIKRCFLGWTCFPGAIPFAFRCTTHSKRTPYPGIRSIVQVSCCAARAQDRVSRALSFRGAVREILLSTKPRYRKPHAPGVQTLHHVDLEKEKRDHVAVLRLTVALARTCLLLGLLEGARQRMKIALVDALAAPRRPRADEDRSVSRVLGSCTDVCREATTAIAKIQDRSPEANVRVKSVAECPESFGRQFASGC